jgi:hypothetical protein
MDSNFIFFTSKQTDHPMVAEAAVVGFPHEIKGQLISEHYFFPVILSKTKFGIIPTANETAKRKLLYFVN